MMPLLLAEAGEECVIRRIGGSSDLRRHLESLGFLAGSSVTVISKIGGNLIVKVKEARIALSEEMARKVMI